uniref:Tip attachment protein J domain-containing protein n=1 Tax=Streptomyces sp. NBC_00093 TaxID=2975649 RepID=A0AAU2A068_9ACTN
MATWPLKRIGEILVDGVWAPVPLREETSVVITRGISAEGSVAQPAGTSVRINDPDAEYSPRNAESTLFGTFGRNTQFRFRVADAPSVPAAVLTDTFTRTVANGWGTSTSGATWVIYDPTGSSPPASAYSVSGGAGKITSSSLNTSLYIATDGLDLDDYEATFTINSDQTAQDNNTEEAILFTPILRVNTTDHQYYMVPISLRPRTGVFGIGGLSVGVQITKVDILNNATRGLCPPRTIPGLGYAVASALRVRVRCQGPELMVRVWADGAVEPDHWHAQTYDESFASGEFGFRARCDADDTTVPIVYSFDDLEVRPLTADDGTVRMVGELSSIDPYEPEDGPASAYVDVDAAGVLRRYDGPQKPARSALARHVAGYRPVAYWPFEEGAQGGTSVAQAATTSPAGPLAVTRFDFAKDSGLFGSKALPTVRSGGTAKISGIPGFATGRWAVYFMMKFTTQGFPTDANEHQILSFSTANATLTLYAKLNGTDPLILIRGVDSSGTAIGVGADLSQAELTAAGLLGFLDRWQQVKVYGQESGGSTTYTLAMLDPDDSGLTTDLGTAAHAADRVRTISTTFGAGAAGMGIGHLSVWGVAFTDAYTQNFPGIATGDIAYELGAPGMPAKDWLSVLAADQGQALETEGPAGTLLGPYYDGSFIDLARAAARTDMGLLTEQRNRLGLRYISREALYDRPVDLVLDYRSGLVFAPFRPKDDDKGLINRITVKRREGSEASAEVSEGPLSVAPPPDGINVNEDSADTIVYSDDQLPSQAGWRLHVATWDAMRVASLTLKMANPRLRPLLDTVLALKEGARIQVVNTPKRYGHDGFDLLVRGSKETHAEGVFDITFTCVPYGPYVTGLVVDSGAAVIDGDARVDTSGTTLTEDVDETETSVEVTVANGRRWVYTAAYPDRFPFNVRVGGEVWTVTAITGTSSPQTFTVIRSVNGVVKSHSSGADLRLNRYTPVAL